jgi:glycosyltransferase involved in cell wall biosynthesis
MENVKPMKILHVVGAMNRAGTETMLMNIFRNIDREKVEFDFISYSADDAHYDEEIKNLGGKVIKLTKTFSIKELYNVMKQNGPYDVVHAHTLFHCGIANIAALLAGVKVRISHAHTTLDNSNGLLRKTYIKLMRFLITTFSTNLLACSKEAGRYLFGKKALNSNQYSYFPNLIDYQQFLEEPKNQAKKFKVKEGLGNNIVIGHIGRFMEAKNHEFLLEIMKEVTKRNSTVKMLLVGDGVLRQQIEKKAIKEGINENIRFVGIRNDIPTMLYSMDVFVFPSKYEGLGLVLLEAQACGVPCIVSEAVQPEADLEIGLVSKLSLKDSPGAWADKIIKVASQKEKNVNKILNGFEKKEYSLPKGISKLLKIYQSTDGGEADEKYIDRLL